MGFIFDPQKGETAKELRDRRKLAELMLARSSSRVPQNLGQGIAALGQALGGRLSLNAVEQAERTGAEGAGNDFSGLARLLSGGSPVASPAGDVSSDSSGLVGADALFNSESGGNFQAQNDEVGAGGLVGHFGRGQFGQARLQEAGKALGFGKIEPQEFLANEGLQRAVEKWHFDDIDEFARSRGIDKRFGETIGGVTLTPAGFRNMAHLGGKGGAAKFVSTGGKHNPADANGTTLRDYATLGEQSSIAAAAPSGQNADLAAVLQGRSPPVAATPAPQPVVSPTSAPAPALPAPAPPQPAQQGFPSNPSLPGIQRIDDEDFQGFGAQQVQVPQAVSPLEAAAPVQADVAAAPVAPAAPQPTPAPSGSFQRMQAAAEVLGNSFSTPEQRQFAQTVLQQELEANRKPTRSESLKLKIQELQARKLEKDLTRDPKLLSPEAQAQAIERSQAGRASTTINNLGSIPPGFQRFTDVDGNVSMRPIPGSPADLEIKKNQAEQRAAEEQTAQRAEVAAGTKATKANAMKTAIKGIKEIARTSKTPFAGTNSRPFALHSDTNAGRVRAHVRTLTSGVALDAIIRLKDASKTGATGFGQMNRAELQLLIDDMGALEPDTTPEDIFMNTINRIGQRFERVIEDIRRNVSPQRLTELGLDELLGTTPAPVTVPTDQKPASEMSDAELIQSLGAN